MSRIGTFKITQSFNVTNRGVIAVGSIINGHVKVGATSTIILGGNLTPVKIMGTEMGNPGADDVVPFGILLAFESPDIELVAKTDRIKEQTIDIYFE